MRRHISHVSSWTNEGRATVLKNTDTLGIQGLGEACEGNEQRRNMPSMALCGVRARACSGPKREKQLDWASRGKREGGGRSRAERGDVHPRCSRAREIERERTRSCYMG